MIRKVESVGKLILSEVPYRALSANFGFRTAYFVFLVFLTFGPKLHADQTGASSAWQRLSQFKGHVFQLICSEGEKCGSVPIVLAEPSPDRLEFELNNTTILEFYLKGSCLSARSSCEKSVEKMTYSTRLLSFENGRLVIEVRDVVFKNSKPVRIELIENPIFSGVQLRLQNSISSNRFGVREAPVFWRALAPSIFRLKMPPPASDSFLYGENAFNISSPYGSGFFISSDGYALTNWHVVTANPLCLLNYVCDLTMGVVGSDGSIQDSTRRFRILAVSRYLDVAVLKLDTRERVSFLEIEGMNSTIGNEVLTIGFPGDREMDAQGALTFSAGQLQGFFRSGFAYVTSAGVSGGASGSPLLNSSNVKVIGLISNGDVNKSMSRPIHIVASYLGLQGYLNGAKELRVKQLMEELQSAETQSDGAVVLERLRRERTLLFGTELEQLAITHTNVNVRTEISRYLRLQRIENGPR